jgi:hypothetical protein
MDYNTNISPKEEDSNAQTPFERPGTPERPPYSPLTPVLAHLAPIPGGATVIPPALDASPAVTPASSTATASTPTSYNTFAEPPRNQNTARRNEAGNRRTNPPPPSMGPPPQPTTIIRPEPSPVPISESDNSDVIALRSAISLLQLQKQKALNDIKTLDEMKRAAAADPEGFSRELLAGNLTQQGQGYGLVDTDLPLEGSDESDGETDDEGSPNKNKFGKIPKPQNVVRMPPINWAKYQIVGESLDKMHEEQRSRPFAGVPRQDLNQRAPEHAIAAPYRPLTDKIESSTKGRLKRDRKTS